jgi:Uncharacterized protein family UPF0016
MAQANDRFGETFGTVPYTRVGRRVPCQGSSPARPRGIFVESFFVSSIVVSLAEIGDTTQILSMTLASRFLNTVSNPPHQNWKGFDNRLAGKAHADRSQCQVE